MLALTDLAFGFSLIGGYVGAGEVLDELVPPIWRPAKVLQVPTARQGESLQLPFLL